MAMRWFKRPIVTPTNTGHLVLPEAYWNEEQRAHVRERWQLSDDEPNAEGWRQIYQHDFANFVKFRREYLQERDAISDAYNAAALKADLAFTDYLTAYDRACEGFHGQA